MNWQSWKENKLEDLVFSTLTPHGQRLEQPRQLELETRRLIITASREAYDLVEFRLEK